MTLRAAARLFFSHTSPRFILVMLVIWTALRIGVGAFGVVDVAILGGVPIFWSFQEWFLHKFVLHIKPRRIFGVKVDPMFAQKHREHHRDPSHLGNVFLPLRVVALAAVVNALAWAALVPSLPQALTGIAGITGMSLVYEWIHFLTHTSYRPRSRYYAGICHSHRRHHFKNEHYWFGFIVPTVDRVLGTSPDYRQVETSPTCRTLGVEDAHAPPPENVIGSPRE